MSEAPDAQQAKRDALRLIKSGDLKEALRVLESAAQWLEAGKVAERLKRHPKAIELYLKADAFAEAANVHLAEGDALGSSHRVERLVHGGQGVESRLFRKGFESLHHAARQGGPPLGRHAGIREMEQLLDHGHLISREEPSGPYHRLQAFGRDPEPGRGLPQEAGGRRR